MVWEWGLLTVGCLCVALALNWFLVPHKIAAGGVSGFAVVVYHTLGIPVGATTLAVNIPLFLAALRVLGAQFGAKTIIASVLMALLIDVTAPYTGALTADTALAAIYGGALSGVGLGLVFRAGGSTGGTDIVAYLLHAWLHLGRGRMLLVADGFVILLAAIFFNAELALYGLLGAFLTSRTLDLLLEGRAYAKAAFIISDHAEEIAQMILTEMDRGVTALDGEGMYTRKRRRILFVIVARNEIVRLERGVARIDPKAFVVVTAVNEVLGEGFVAREQMP